MAYFHKIAEAESCLSRGDLLGSEALLRSARELHGQSRFRAPLVERGIDPVLRVGRKLLRRTGEGPVLPNFPARADRLEQEIHKLASRREREASELALVDDHELLPEHLRACEAFLLLHRESEVIRIPTAIVWRLLRSYLLMHADGFDSVEPDLLPAPFDVPEDERGWLGQWVRLWLRETEGRPPQLAAALLRWAEHFARMSEDAEAEVARWCSLAARLSLVGPADGVRALQWGRLALDLPLAEEEAWLNLRLVASLECNQNLIATSGVESRGRLARLSVHAQSLGRHWPPPELEELLDRRDPTPGRSTLVLAHSDSSQRRLVLLRTHRARPVDAVLLELEEEDSSRSDFGYSPARGREVVEAWLHPGDMVLAEHESEGVLAAMVPRERLLFVADLEASLPQDGVARRAAAPVANHPLLDRPQECGEWGELLQDARGLLPRALDRLRSPAIRSDWGRENLRRLASVGLERCGALERLLGILAEHESLEGEGQDFVLQPMPLQPQLQWPVLASRPWPETLTGLTTPTSELREDLVIAHRPSCEELATEALAMQRVALMITDEDRAAKVAALLAGSIDSRRVTWQRHAVSCPLPELRCLGRWIGEAISHPERELDVLWLYQGLCSTPEANVESGMDTLQRPRAWAELAQSRDGGCEADCALSSSAEGCWPQQLERRRENGRVWLADTADLEVSGNEALLVDDLAGWVDDADSLVQQRLTRLESALRTSHSFLVHADAGPFGDSLAAALSPWLPPERRPLPHTRAWTHSVDVLAVPPGYRPDAVLLREESELLLAERSRLWNEAVGRSPRWTCANRAESDSLQGRAEAPQSKVVVVERLGDRGEVDPLVQLLRMARASTHSSQLLVCLDPRLADCHPQLLRRVHTPTPLGLGAKALAPGAEVFAAKRAQRPPNWNQPVTVAHLQWAMGEKVEVDGPTAPRLRSLANAFQAWQRGRRLALAALSDEERAAVARVLHQLARDSRDGAGLGVQRVVWVGDGESPFDGAADVCVVDATSRAESPSVEHRAVVVSPALLADPRVEEWASRSSRTAWILAHAELHLRDGVLGAGRGLPRLADDSRLLACIDDPDSLSVAESLDCEFVALPLNLGDWTWQRHRAPDQQQQCTSCGYTATVEHPLSLCGRCGRVVLRSEECDAVSRAQRVAGLREQLASGETGVLVVAVDRAQRDELRHQLGLAILDEEDGSLWAGRSTSQAFGHDVVTLADLCETTPSPGRVLLDHLPRDARVVRGLVLRLHMAGWPKGCLEVLDHPLQWHSDRPLRRDAPSDAWSELAGRRLRWEAGRAEIEFRYAQALAEMRRELSRQAGQAEGNFFAGASRGVASGSSAALLEALGTDDPGRTRILSDDVELFSRARSWMSTTLDRVASIGLELDPPTSARLLLSELDETPLLARRSALLLAWAKRERLLSSSESEAPRHDSHPMLSIRLRRAASETKHPLELDELYESGGPETSTEAAPLIEAADYLSLASTGRSQALVAAAGALSDRGERVLCLLPEAASLLRWGDELHRVVELEVLTATELAVAIVAEAAEKGGEASPRPLPPAGSIVGEEIRQGLLREVSRLYAQESGRVPPVDSRALRRLLEEEGALVSMAAAGDDATDVTLLHSCIHEARRRHGWLEARDLFDVAADRVARDEECADRWRRHFDALLIDDAHAFDDRARDLIELLFRDTPRWSMADPWLVDREEGRREFRAGKAHARIPRDIAAAMEVVARDRPVAGWRLRGARRLSRGSCRSERVLNLEACVRHLLEHLSQSAEEGENHVMVLGHENDRRQAILRLREEGHRVWDAEVVARYASAGPRELLALAILVFDDEISPEMFEGLTSIVLRTSRWDFSDLALGARADDEVTGLADCVSAAIHELRSFVRPERPLRELFERARLAGLLESTAVRASIRQRVEEFLTLVGSQPWTVVKHQIDYEAVLDARRASGVVWCARPRDLHGLGFDHVFHVCSGYEDATRHLLVASRARRSLHVLYSEVDPFRRDG